MCSWGSVVDQARGETIEHHDIRISPNAVRTQQIADNPGRHEPGTGEINYGFLFDLLRRIGYSGWIGCEYKPATTTEAGLGWRQQLLAA